MRERTEGEADPTDPDKVLGVRGGRGGFDLGRDVRVQWHGWLPRRLPELARASVHYYNTEEEVARFAAAVAALA